MKSPFTQASLLYVVFTVLFLQKIIAQDTRAFNQNASRSNHTTRSFNQNSSRSNNTGLSISFGPVYSSSLNKENDSLLFRGSGTGFRFGGDYSFGKASIGLVSGFGSSSPDEATINNFLKRSGIPQDQLFISKAKQQNMYLLVGPSIQFGNVVQISAHAKGGLFINNSGLINIQQRGGKSVYRNESTDKSVYPGFLTGLNVQYSTKSDIWSFGFGVDYMNTRSEVNNYDARRGGGIEPLKLSGKITDVVAGISIRYNINSPRDAQSGMASGRRVLPTVNKREIAQAREAGSGMATGRQLGKPKYEDMNLSDGSTDNGSCGPVTMTKTNPDGTTEEMTFSCPDDAANYSERLSTNMTVPKQTQGATFGEKVNAGLHAAGSAVSQGSSLKGIISGTVTWPTSNSTGIITNSTIADHNNAGTTNQSSFGTMVRLVARDAQSGMATGKRSRDAGSGMATGRRQYEPIFIENGGSVCNPCIADVKMASVKNNPLYEQSGNSGSNPMFESKNRTTGDDDCDGIAGINVYLVDLNSGSVISRTTTQACGEFFFANVPYGTYIVRLSGNFTAEKKYDVSVKSKTDLAGSVAQTNEAAQLFLNTDGDNNNGMMQKAGISTSRSNIRTKSLAIIEADLDGDGEFESLRATATFSDGSTQDITLSARTATATKSITIDGTALQMARRRVEVLKSNRLSSITIKNTDGRYTATGTFSDGSSRDITNDISINTSHNGIKQYNITIADADGDGAAEAVVKTKTKSNQSNDRIAAGNMNDDDIGSPRSNIKMLNVATGDVNGDGVAETIIGGALPGGAVISAARMGDPVHGVDVKPGITGDAMRPGSPIGGLSIKGGKNPGGNFRTIQTNENGEFEFPGMEAGDYTFSIEQNIFIEDETLVTIGEGTEDMNNGQDDGIMARKGWDGVVKGNSKIINSGEEGIAIDMNDAVTFRWTPLVPKPKETVTYKLRVWQLMQGQNGTQAMRSNKPVAERSMINASEVSVNSIVTGPCKPPYLCDFIWSVDAVNAAGKLINSNTGSGSFSINNGAVTKAQDYNSSRSNKTASAISTGGDIDDNVINTKTQDHNSSRSNKTASAISTGGDIDDNIINTKAQDHNSSRSNKTASNISGDIDNNEETDSKNIDPVKWFPPESMQKTINTTRDNIKSMLTSLDELEQQLDADQTSNRSGINTSRSNIKNQRTRINELEQTLNNLQTKDKEAAMKELEQKRNETDIQFLKLQQSLQDMGQKYSSISNVLKTRHDIAMNAIRNMK